MATTPITPTYTFAAASGSIPLSQLDTNFTQLTTFLNNPNNFANYLVDSGAANAYVVAFAAGDAPTSYIAGLTLVIKITNANSSASTLNVNSLGVKNITKNGATALAGGELQASSVVVLVYDGTQFQLITSVASPGGSNTQVQFNNSGAFGGSSSLTWNGTTLSANALSLTTALPIASGGTNATTSGAALTSLGASPVAGSTSLTTLGTVGTGTWNASLIGGTYGGTGVNNGSNTITVAGNVSHAGAFTQTFTAGANTSLSLPASGTLISTVTNMAANPVTGTPSGSNFLRGDGTWASPATTPGGSTTQVQYNNSGAFAGSSAFTFDATTGSLVLSTGNISTVDNFGNKNRIINSSFRYWRYQVYQGDPYTVTTSVKYGGPDRFAFYQGTTADIVVSRAYTAGTVPAGFKYSMKVQRPIFSTNTNTVYIYYVLESMDSIDFAGGYATFSFWAKADASWTPSGSLLGVAVSQNTSAIEGTAAGLRTGSGWTSTSSTQLAMTTTWTRYSYTVAIGSTTQQIGLKLYFTPFGSANSSDSIWITGLQLERGQYMTQYDVKPTGTELSLCNRYLTAINGQDGYATFPGYTDSTTTALFTVPFTTTMRAQAIFVSATAYPTIYFTTTAVNLSGTVTNLNTSNVNATMSLTFASATTAGLPGYASMASGTSLILYSAEL
jgi:hypothetical protein